MVNTTAKEPGFVDPARGDLSLADDAPAAKMRKLLPVSLALIEQDAPFEVAAPAAAGAWQGKDRLRLGVTVPGFPPDPVWRKEVEGLDVLLRSLRDQLIS